MTPTERSSGELDDLLKKARSHRHQIDQTCEHVAGGPGYDPELVTNETYWNNVYGYYGYQPYWTPGYLYPTYPWNPLTSPLTNRGGMGDPSSGVPGDVDSGSTADDLGCA